ncbi:hypothetical protein Ciccas_012726 [Cichlidogyrus casuarinus]|uniref:Uncharacterized protein n=1 Tax=Cichlidogyrus casuarinus TaxID=1844966 RepID=A0ABD2PPE0_9PLAT
MSHSAPSALIVSSEAVLMSMLSDEEENQRVRAALRIVEIRREKNECVRQFSAGPKGKLVVNLEATDYTEVAGDIFSKNCVGNVKVTAPPIVQFLSDAELIEKAKDNQLKFARIPCHTQTVEKEIQKTNQVTKSQISAVRFRILKDVSQIRLPSLRKT